MRAWIRKRPTKHGATFQVLYRRGGRAYRIECAGTFPTRRDADRRCDTVQGWLAQGLDPVSELDRLAHPPQPLTFESAAKSWEQSLVDVAASSKRAYVNASAFWSSLFAGRDPRTLTVADLQEAVASSGLAPRTLRAYRVALRGTLDHAGVDPNPARSRMLKWPRIEVEQVNPPEADTVAAILERLPVRLRLPLAVQEQCGLRVGEVESLTWQDVDERGCRFRLRAESTKRGRSRFVPVPPWLMNVVAELVPREDRSPERRVFAGFSDAAARSAMTRACKLGGLAHHSPHDLRHRRVSLWFQRGESAVQIAQWAGHTASMSLDVYGHVMVGGEVPEATLRRLLGRGGDAAVMTADAETAAAALT